MSGLVEAHCSNCTQSGQVTSGICTVIIYPALNRGDGHTCQYDQAFEARGTEVHWARLIKDSIEKPAANVFTPRCTWVRGLIANLDLSGRRAFSRSAWEASS